MGTNLELRADGRHPKLARTLVERITATSRRAPHPFRTCARATAWLLTHVVRIQRGGRPRGYVVVRTVRSPAPARWWCEYLDVANTHGLRERGQRARSSIER